MAVRVRYALEFKFEMFSIIGFAVGRISGLFDFRFFFFTLLVG